MKLSAKKILIILGVILSIVVGVILIMAITVAASMSKLGPCAYMSGPIYGKSILVDMDTIKADETLNFKGGKFIVRNRKGLTDSLTSTLLIRLDKNNKVIWARNLGYVIISNLSITDKTLNFFNKSFGEPAHIYLGEDYKFKYMCQLPM